MDAWVDNIHKRAQILVEQIVSARAVAASSEIDLSGIERQSMELLDRLYREDFPAAQLHDVSDIVLHAEGPGADHIAPSLHSFNWITTHIREQLKKLSASVIPMSAGDVEKIAKDVEWSFNGYAPGSIMVGFSLVRPASMNGMEDADKEAYDLISSSAQLLAVVPQFVDQTGVNHGINQEIKDPAMRDSAIIAAWSMAPTTQSGIDSIQFFSKSGASGSLSTKKRAILREAIKSPKLTEKVNGKFAGTMRAVDLDRNRAVLRDVHDIGSIRCILPKNFESQAKAMLGADVIVEGEYERDESGRPRLMRVSTMKPNDQQKKIDI